MHGSAEDWIFPLKILSRVWAEAVMGEEAGIETITWCEVNEFHDLFVETMIRLHASSSESQSLKNELVDLIQRAVGFADPLSVMLRSVINARFNGLTVPENESNGAM